MSTISQIESNLIYPLCCAPQAGGDALPVEVSAFFREPAEATAGGGSLIKRGSDERSFRRSPKLGDVQARLLTPLDLGRQGEPYLIEIPPKRPLAFLRPQGRRNGIPPAWEIAISMKNSVYALQSGEVVYLTPTPISGRIPVPARPDFSGSS